MKSLPNKRVSSERTASTGSFLALFSDYLYPFLPLTSSLDRTNFVQDILSRTNLEQYLALVHREWIQANPLWTYHRELWAENGDSLSRIYAGTGALNTSFTRSGKRTFAGM
jgi:hypothetical protein